MSLANLIALVSSVNADPSTTPDHEEVITHSVVVARSESPKVRKSKPAKNEAAPIHQKSGTPGIVMPDRGTLDAKAFLLAMRDAGKRCTAEGKPFIDQREVRNDQIKAIHAFFYEMRQGQKVHVGYNPTGDFGSQEQAARMLAQRELRGAPKVVEVAKPSRSVAGYVAGMPEPSQRILANLRAREQAACEAMLDAKTEQERSAHAATLKQVQAAIDGLVG